MSYPEIETDRLVLRQFRHSDLDAFASFASNEETMRFIGGACNRDEAWRRMAVSAGHWALRGFGPWAVEEKATGRFIGRAGLWYPEGWPGPEVIWALLPANRGQGFATEAARASMRFAFETLGMDQVCSLIHPDNLPSVRVAERIGHRLTGTWEKRDVTAFIYSSDRLTC